MIVIMSSVSYMSGYLSQMKLVVGCHVVIVCRTCRSAESASAAGRASVVVPVRLKHSYEVLDAFCFFVPAVVGWAWSKVRW